MKKILLVALLTVLFLSTIQTAVVFAEGDSVFVSGITVTPVGDVTNVKVGQMVQFNATITPDDATDKTVIWSSSNEAIATIGQDGVMTAVSAGSVTITALANDGSGVSDSIILTVVWFMGEGTSDDPYIINTADDLSNLAFLTRRNIAKYTQAAYSLVNDIEASSIVNWSSIGGDGYPFMGVFDGNGFVISNLKQNAAVAGNVYGGLFGYIQGATIRNLDVTGCDINMSGTTGHGYVGGIAGYVDTGSSILNCSVTGSIKVLTTIVFTSEWVGSNAGGIAGYVVKGCSIQNCHTSGAVSASINSPGTNKHGNAGGIVGYAAGYGGDITIEDCENTGTVNAASTTENGFSSAGGIAGVATSTHIVNCSSNGSINATNSGSGSCHAGGIAGDSTFSTVTGCHSVGICLAKATQSGGTAGSIVGCQTEGLVEDCYNESDITIPAVMGYGGITGSLNNGTIRNCRNMGNITLGYDMTAGGIVAGGNNGIIIDCSNTGNMFSSSNGSAAGGIAGFLQSGTISRCFNTGDVKASNAGGVLGYQWGRCVISDCYNIGAISGSYYSGGIAGTGSNTTISNCYNLGTVSTAYRWGGIVGDSNGSVVTGCYYLDCSLQGMGSGTDTTVRISSDQLIQPGTFSGFDFDAVWSSEGEYNFPDLRSNIQTKTVFFHSQGGSYVKPVSTDRNTTCTEPPQPTRSGHSFAGWFKNPTLSAEWNFSDDVVLANQVLFAKWTVSNYVVHYDYRDGNGIVDVTAMYDTTIVEPPAPSRAGYQFGGWYREAACINSWNFDIETVKAEITLYAKWTPKVYTVSFHPQGGAVDPAMKDVTFEGKYGSLPDPNRAGYSFDGWYLDSACNGLPVNAETIVNTASSHTLFAKWAANAYSVTFDAQGGTLEQATKAVTFDSQYGPLPEPSWTGYRFGGWFLDSNYNGLPVSVDTTVVTAGDHILYAKWIANIYTVSFDAQGGTVEQATKDVAFNSQYGPLPEPSRTGYVFSGWFMDRDCSGLPVVAEATVVTASHHVVYAKWTISTCTVTFSSQGGTAVSPKTAPYNTAITAPTPPTRSGYTFQGWYKDASCTTAWNFAADMVATDITLYAKWASTTPAAVKAVLASYTSIKVTWNAVPGASGYQVYQATSSAGPWTLKGTVATTSFTSTGLVTGKYYYYKIRSYNAAKVYSVYSATVSARPIPATPYSVKATAASYSSAKVSWAAASGATRYEVYRATSSTGTYSLVGTTTATSFTNTALKTGSTYYYKVRCYHLEGSTKVYSAFSAVVSVKTAIGTPASVRAARASSTSIKVTWGAVSGATRYEVWRSTSATGTYSLVGTTSSLYYINTSLTTGRLYYYKVRAYHLEGSTKVYSAWSAVVSAKP